MKHSPLKMAHPAMLSLVMAVVAMVLGIVVYLLDRDAGSVYFMSDWMVLGDGQNSVFGLLGQHIPTFVHVYTFILLTMALVVPEERYRQYLLPVCIGWFLIDALFEIAQIDSIAQRIAGWVPDWFAGIPFLENTASYFIHSTFDILDLLSIGLGTLAAYVTIQIILKRSAHSATPVCQ
ncbi:hypothetical protein [Kaarinaea lacus]